MNTWAEHWPIAMGPMEHLVKKLRVVDWEGG